MKKTIVYWFFLTTITIIGACEATNTHAETKEKIEAYSLPEKMAAYYTVVVAKHDTAMLLMGDIERTQRALRAVLSQQEGAAKTNVLEALTFLQKADDGMMTWMHEFKSTALYEEEYKNLSEAEIEGYLQEEEQKIEQVHVEMSSSIAQGKALLEQLNNQ
ncbi:MAG: hypothetical protein AB8E82_03990 [Aureispira sp.]